MLQVVSTCCVSLLKTQDYMPANATFLECQMVTWSILNHGELPQAFLCLIQEFFVISLSKQNFIQAIIGNIITLQNRAKSERSGDLEEGGCSRRWVTGVDLKISAEAFSRPISESISLLQSYTFVALINFIFSDR